MYLTTESLGYLAAISCSRQKIPPGAQDFPTLDLQSLRRKVSETRRRILVVDDNPINRKFMRILLENNGQEVVQACNGLEAVALVNEEPFDVVLMDLQMPVMSGFEAAERIRTEEFEKGLRVPIIAITAICTLESQKRRCLEIGMDAYLTKPLIEDLFWKTLLDIT